MQRAVHCGVVGTVLQCGLGDPGHRRQSAAGSSFGQSGEDLGQPLIEEGSRPSVHQVPSLIHLEAAHEAGTVFVQIDVQDGQILGAQVPSRTGGGPGTRCSEWVSMSNCAATG